MKKKSYHLLRVALLMLAFLACDLVSEADLPEENTPRSSAAATPLSTAAITPTGAPVSTYDGVIEGDTYYVSTQGDDDEEGDTPGTALATLEYALEIVQPGDAIFILPGVYNETLEVYDLGSAQAPITIRGEGAGVVLDGQREHALGFWCEGCTNIIFDNLEIRNYSDVGLTAYLSSNIVMRNISVHHNGFEVQLVDWELEGYGILVDVSEQITVEDCEAYHNGPDPKPFGMLGMGINLYECTDCVVRNNLAYDNIGGGILVEDSVNVLVEDNEVTDNYLDATEDEWWDGGLWLDGGHDVLVRNNLFKGNIGPGIQVSNEDNQEPYGYVLENNISTENIIGIYIWNFGTRGFPSEDILLMIDNQIFGNTDMDFYIVPWECPPDDPCE